MGSGWHRNFWSGPTSGGDINTDSRGCLALYKTELVFLLFLQYSRIWLQVSVKEMAEVRCLSLLLCPFTPGQS